MSPGQSKADVTPQSYNQNKDSMAQCPAPPPAHLPECPFQQQGEELQRSSKCSFCLLPLPESPGKTSARNSVQLWVQWEETNTGLPLIMGALKMPKPLFLLCSLHVGFISPKKGLYGEEGRASGSKSRGLGPSLGPLPRFLDASGGQQATPQPESHVCWKQTLKRTSF